MGIFADVLYQTLCDHRDTDYSYLGGGPARKDPIWHPLRLVPVPPQVIQRLKEATHKPLITATLNAELLELTVTQLRFSEEEKTTLRAALLAQGAEMFLRARMKPEEQGIVNDIVGMLYSELRGRLQKLIGDVRGRSTMEGLELALTFFERAGEMSDAASVASKAGDHAMAFFWFKLARKAYEEALPLLRSHDPEFADEIARLIQPLPE